MFDAVRNFLGKRRIAKDLEVTFLKTFDLLMAANRQQDYLRKRYDTVAALASCLGALRDTYPGAIVEEGCAAMSLVEANVKSADSEVGAILEAILGLVRDCPNNAADRIGVVSWLVAPRMAQRARDAGHL